MKIGYQYYQLTGEALIQEAQRLAKLRNKMIREAAKFAKKYGANHKEFLTHSYGMNGRQVAGFYFEEYPGELWMKASRDEFRCYRPRKSSKELYAEFDAIPKFSTDSLAEMVQFKPIFHDMHMYMFNPFWTDNGKKAGFRAPVFSEKSIEMDPKIKYKAPKGVKKISLKEYDRIWAGAD